MAVALEMREKGTDRNDLFDRLAADSRLGLSAETLDALLAEPLAFTGAARDQVAAVVAGVDELLGRRARRPPTTGPSRSSDGASSRGGAARTAPAAGSASRSGRPTFQ